MLENIGINGRLLSFQIINFLVLIFILNKFLYKPVLKMIQDRQSEINKGLRLTEDMQIKEEGLVKDREKVLKRAREEAQALLEQKKQEAVKVREKIIAEARQEKEAIVASGKREIEANRRDMEKKLEQDVLEIAYGMTEKVLQDVLTKKDHEVIIHSQLKKLGLIKSKK
ncbi:ATP synthase F0 subunit B [Candidatus Roizmanbacteria bacterium CG22_combo_CG10-13_8_21_14_all_38_20]|uniref:ATP synthase subunit b n=1 Tax=Candidatus Roizmanbacteria bacterium CG22_combo_CG10-13_8_21_14_all_38_20 TaxID=1974862 RepID=A0A2H0BUK0_9BACT|nr:F0F1 ATP synthase subunit B [Candidatus Microgenomates bacterium]PIP61367.1 MAG: ATP synthase F0 subunit B [Candidatus Roizmanbacteria bacterium CG22_combo_CG10-13_8_21_14_all_38_20]PJC31477.1 MAG: ATP synthase F0 subunit B [Candidatus Roizmanbacteria bacterium CG_4_9_14_0_2_um_filter_38_17]